MLVMIIPWVPCVLVGSYFCFDAPVGFVVLGGSCQTVVQDSSHGHHKYKLVDCSHACFLFGDRGDGDWTAGAHCTTGGIYCVRVRQAELAVCCVFEKAWDYGYSHWAKP